MSRFPCMSRVLVRILQYRISDAPDTLCGDCKQQYVCFLHNLLGGKLGTDRLYAVRKDVVLQDIGVSVVLVEKFHLLWYTRPQPDVVCRVSEVVSETAAKVARTEYQYLALLCSHRVWQRGDWKVGWADESCTGTRKGWEGADR